MVDVGVALAWVAMSGVSLRWLSALAREPADVRRDPELALLDGEPQPQELYPIERLPLPAGGFR